MSLGIPNPCHHMTLNAGILDSLTPYVGSNQVVVGNGAIICIAHTESLMYTRNGLSLHLKNVLLVPFLTHNLLSVSKLCRDNNCSITFNDCSFVINDLLTVTPILH